MNTENDVHGIDRQIFEDGFEFMDQDRNQTIDFDEFCDVFSKV